VELGREFRENAIQAEERFLGKTATVVGRVSSVTHPPRIGFLVEIAPRYPAEPRALTCELNDRTRRAAASLRRNELAIFSGKLQQDEHRRLLLRNCAVEYLFSQTSDKAARSTERCFSELFAPMHTTLIGTDKDLEAYSARVKQETAEGRLDCSNPVIVMSF